PARLGEPDGPLLPPRRDGGQVSALLLLGAVDAHRLAAGERGNPPHPGQAGQRAGQLPGQNHLGHDVAALAAVLLSDADGVEAGVGELAEQLVRERVLVLLQVPRPRLGQLPVDEVADALAEELLLLAVPEIHRAPVIRPHRADNLPNDGYNPISRWPPSRR